MDLSLLETMRVKIMTDKDFSKIFAYFYDHFGEDPAFFEASEPMEAKPNDLLVQLLGQIGGAILKTEKIALTNLRLLRVAEYQFIHGGFGLNDALGTVLYCEDLQKGIVALHRPRKNQPVHFARFSAEMLAPNLTREAGKFNQ